MPSPRLPLLLWLSPLLAPICALLLGGCGASGRGEGAGESLPSALVSLAPGHEITAFSGYSVPDLDLYVVALVGVADRSDTRVIGVEREGGRLVSGAPLFLRAQAGGPSPAELARRALGILFSEHGRPPLEPEAGAPSDIEAREWALVRPPRVEEGSLIFWAIRGDMAPALVEYRVLLRDGSVQTQLATEALLASGEPVPVGGLRCMPLAPCGCWMECAPVLALRLPGDEEIGFRVEGGPHAGQIWRQRPDCSTVQGRHQCRRVCRADLPQADCDDGLVQPEEACSEACPPSEAPFHCELIEGGCRRVEHPIRAATR